MALPTLGTAWAFSLCNRITYASVVQVARDTMYLVKNFLVAHGHTVKGSCNGTTGAMDGVDRWASAADAGTRFNGAGGAQSWIVLTNADGSDTCFSYNSAADDIYRVAVSHAGDYVAAGTPAQQPTATNEQLVNTFFTTTTAFQTIVKSTASGDRLVSIWARTDGKGFRVAVARAGVWVTTFGNDRHSAVPYAGGVTVAPSHGFGGAMETATLVSSFASDSPATAVANTMGPRFVVMTNLGAKLASCAKGCEAQGLANASMTIDAGKNFAPELQGSTEYPLSRIGIYSTLASSRGKVGNLIDWWIGRITGVADGDTYGNREFIVINALYGLVWPWDGTPGVAGTAVVMT